jgi:hypothetical protein
VEALKRDKNVLMGELVRVRQQQQASASTSEAEPSPFDSMKCPIHRLASWDLYNTCACSVAA